MPRQRIASWSLWSESPMPAFHRPHMSGDLRMVPSPVQGTSQSTRSKAKPPEDLSSPFSRGNSCALWFVTSTCEHRHAPKVS